MKPTGDLELFRALARLSGELVVLHLLEFEVSKRDEKRRHYPQLTECIVPTKPELKKISYPP